MPAGWREKRLVLPGLILLQQGPISILPVLSTVAGSSLVQDETIISHKEHCGSLAEHQQPTPSIRAGKVGPACVGKGTGTGPTKLRCAQIGLFHPVSDLPGLFRWSKVGKGGSSAKGSKKEGKKGKKTQNVN